MHFTHQTKLMQDLRLLWPIYRDTSWAFCLTVICRC